MSKLLTKFAIYVLIIVFAISIVNYKVDPANIFHFDVVDEMVEALSKGEFVIADNDIDEGYFKKQMIPCINFTPKTVIIGSSHIMYIDWERLYVDTLNAGMSGAFLGEYYAVVGMLKANNIIPDRIIFGVDAWAFTRNAELLRHTTLNNYAYYARSLVKGEDVSYSDYDIETNKRDINKYKELFSFTYFQSSIRNICNNGILYYFDSNDTTSRIEICEDDKADDSAEKITPSMRYIMPTSNYGTVEQNDLAADRQINPPNVYQIGTEYIQLDKNNYNEFIELIDYLLAEGIDVSFYLPSYYPSMYDLFMNDKSFQGVIEVEEVTRRIAMERGIEVHGSYNPYEAGVTKEDFADVLHMKPDVMLDNYLYMRD